MMIKKVMAWVLVSLMLLCSGALAETAEPAWDRDADEHWQVLATGEVVERGAHVMEDVVCTVCGSEIWVFEDGAVDIYNYNGYGDLVRMTSLDGEGNLLYEYLCVMTYDEEGNKVFESQYDFGILVGETAYGVTEEGGNQPIWSAGYYEDGTSARNEYDVYGNCVRAYTFDVDGSILAEIYSEYALSDDGWYYEMRNTTIMGDITFINEYNQYGDWTYSTIVEADGTVLSDVTFTYEYVNGMKISSCQYSFGVLVMESWYGEWEMVIREVEYHADGTTTVYEYDGEGNLIE